MADNHIHWSALSGETTAVPSAAGLINLSAAALVAGSEIDNSAGDQYADFKLKVRGADTFHAGDFVSVWILRDITDAEYEDGSASVEPARPADMIFPVRAVSTQQIIGRALVPLPPGKITFLVKNSTSHNFTNTAGENVLTYVSYVDNLVTA